MRKRNLLACVKISNCFWKRHTVAKIDAHWAPSGNLRVFFSSKISWKRFSFYLKNYEEIRTSSLGQRSTPRRVSMTCWILFQSSLSSLSISKYSSVWSFVDQYHRQSISLLSGNMMEVWVVMYLVFAPLHLSWLNVDEIKTLIFKHPQGLGEPNHALRNKEVDLRIMEHLTLCRGNITAVLNTPSRLRKW